MFGLFGPRDELVRATPPNLRAGVCDYTFRCGALMKSEIMVTGDGDEMVGRKRWYVTLFVTFFVTIPRNFLQTASNLTASPLRFVTRWRSGA